MNPSRSAYSPGTHTDVGVGLVAGWTRFWFSPVDPIDLHALRVLAGLLFLFWLLPLAGQVDALFGLAGWFDAGAYRDTSHLPELPPHVFSWSLLYACGTDPVRLQAVYWLAIAVVVLFTLGLWTRVTSVLTWAVVLSFTANPAIAYDSDPFFLMLAFYLMLGYLLLGQWRAETTWLERLFGARGTWLFRRGSGADAVVPSVGANLAVRLFQVHFAIAMVAGGFHKLQVHEWWSGEALWFYLHPALSTTLPEVRSYAPSAAMYLNLLSFAAYLTLAWQIAFPVFAWRRGARLLLLGGAGIALLADAFLLHLPLMGPITAIGCLSYLPAAAWRRLADWAVALPGLRTLYQGSSSDASPSSAPLVKGSVQPAGHRG